MQGAKPPVTEAGVLSTSLARSCKLAAHQAPLYTSCLILGLIFREDPVLPSACIQSCVPGLVVINDTEQARQYLNAYAKGRVPQPQNDRYILMLCTDACKLSVLQCEGVRPS